MHRFQLVSMPRREDMHVNPGKSLKSSPKRLRRLLESKGDFLLQLLIENEAGWVGV